MPDLIFLDCEASSLHPHSHPPLGIRLRRTPAGQRIEIGWARLSASGEITVDSALIKPAPSWDDWDPAAEKVHGILMGDLYAYGMAPPDAIQKIASTLAGETVYSDSERDKTWCRRLFDLDDRGNPFLWRHVDALLSSCRGGIGHEHMVSDIAYQVAFNMVEQSGPVPHRAGPDAARLAVFYAMAQGIDREIGMVAGDRAAREASFARAEQARRALIERYRPLLARPSILINSSTWPNASCCH